MREPFGLWQELSRSPGLPRGDGYFYDFCDAIEVNANNESAPAGGWGLEHALGAYGSYMAQQAWDEQVFPFQPLFGTGRPADCFSDAPRIGSHTPPTFINVTIDNEGRSWDWVPPTL